MAIISLCPSRGVLALLYLLLWRLTCRSVSEPVSVWNKPIVETAPPALMALLGKESVHVKGMWYHHSPLQYAPDRILDGRCRP